MIEVLQQQALDWAFRAFRKRRTWRDSQVEIGCLLWNRNGKLDPGNFVVSPNASAVALYTPTQLEELLLPPDSRKREYIGDFHAHVARANSLLAQFPSPEDIVAQSSLCDLWDLGPAVDHEALPLAPKMQLIQSFMFGDVFMLLPAQGRSAFTSLSAQDAEMARIGAEYEAWHQAAHNLFGTPTDIQHAAFVELVHRELPRINAIFHQRGILSFHPNPFIGREPADP